MNERTPPLGGRHRFSALLCKEIFSKMKVTEVLYSATFIADMALAMLFSFLLSSSCWR